MKLLFQFLSKWGNLLLLFSLLLLFNILLSSILPKEYALDLMFAYSAKEAYSALGHLDPEQIRIYKIGTLLLDMPYIAIYSLLFSGLMVKIWGSKNAAWLPVVIGVMDFFENLSVLRLLAVYPLENQSLAVLASLFTTSKWVMVGVLFFAMSFGLARPVFSKKHFPAKSAEARI
jgi:hypothetical protein